MAALKMMLDPTRLGTEAETLEEKNAQADYRTGRRHPGDRRCLSDVAFRDVEPGTLPIGNFLFLGPTGSGKTRTVEAVAESLVGDGARSHQDRLVQSFSKGMRSPSWIGSPPGYLGHRETHAMLSQEALNQYHTESVKLSFSCCSTKIEKASDALWNLLLGILDKATLTLGDNRRVDFSNAMIFMTGNLGAAEMSCVLRLEPGICGRPPLGRVLRTGWHPGR